MKTIPPSCPTPEVGRKYWRSLDQLADTPEFRTWAEREFPQGASEWTDPVSRRHFVQIMSASFLLGGLGLGASGCRRPEQKIYPFSKMPEDYTHGVAQFYATARPTRTGAVPLVVKSNDGRPTKIEGNSQHPFSNGGTDRWTQASILDMYDPDRATHHMKGSSVTNVEPALDFLSGISKEAQGTKGQGLCFLMEPDSSPSRRRLQKVISDKFPQARWFVHDPIDLDVHRRAASQAFGKSVQPRFDYAAAKVIVSLDCDFIGSEDNAHDNIRQFSRSRHVEKPSDMPNRLYVVESLMSLTGVNADHRLRLPASAILQVAAGLVGEVFKEAARGFDLSGIGKAAGVDSKWIAECARDLMQNRTQSLVVAGHRQPLVVHLLANAMNAALGNIGKTVLLHELPESKEAGLVELAQALNAGQVQTLVILGGNPVYTAPSDLNWAATQRKAKTIVRLAYFQEDETTAACDWQLAQAHFLESWGDAVTADGTLVPVQPLIAPLFGGLTEIEVLARIAGEGPMSGYEIARESFAARVGAAGAEAAWRKYLHDGFLAGSAAKHVDSILDEAAINKVVATVKAPQVASKEKLDVVFHRDYSVDDGRFNNNGWLQEMPDPITKMVWDNAVLISRKTAWELGVENMNLVEIKVGGRSVRGPIWIQPGFADNTVGLGLGYGRTKTGRVGKEVGFNAYPLRAVGTEHIVSGATLTRTGQNYQLACTQDHWSLEGRPIIREMNLEQFRKEPSLAKEMSGDEEVPAKPLYPNPFDTLKEKGLHQWGMSIDLNKCVGCSACMMACQSENNVPIVGKDQVRRGREMHWLRIDRYYSGLLDKSSTHSTWRTEEEQQFEAWIDDPQVVTQPMLCQHCESAPCENVCPVNATVHDQEGLNLMVYNRCVGTRYCSNNCPYKVRKFNYFDYNKRGFGKDLYLGPLHKRKEDEWDLLKMSKNPDVTVRMRGVMEKCTYCVQRIENAKITQKVKAGASSDVHVPDGTFTTACAQACPAGAIVFGNIADPESRVSKLKQQERDYSVLDFLLTKPRTTYLAKVRNPNPAMPDYPYLKEGPLSYQSFKQKNGDHAAHGGEANGGEEHGAHAAEPAEKGAQ